MAVAKMYVIVLSNLCRQSHCYLHYKQLHTHIAGTVSLIGSLLSAKIVAEATFVYNLLRCYMIIKSSQLDTHSMLFFVLFIVALTALNYIADASVLV